MIVMFRHVWTGIDIKRHVKRWGVREFGISGDVEFVSFGDEEFVSSGV